MSILNEDFIHQPELDNKILGTSQIIKDNDKYDIKITQNQDGTKNFIFMDTKLGDYLNSIQTDPADNSPVISFVAELMNDDDDFFKALEYADLNDNIIFIDSQNGKNTIKRQDVEEYNKKVINPEAQRIKDELKLNAFRNNRPNYDESVESIRKCITESLDKAESKHIMKWKLSKIKPLQNESISQFLRRMDELFCK